MKNLFLIALVLFSLPSNGQVILDEWEEIVPFSQSEKYKDIIEAWNIHTMILPSYDNDSLFRAFNDGKNRDQAGSNFTYGIPIDTLINIKRSGVKFKIEEGTLWLYTIESPTAREIDVKIKKPEIPEGAYLSFIGEEYVGHDPVTYTREMVNRRNRDYLWAGAVGNRVTIEYFEPNNTNNEGEIIILGYSYYFASYYTQFDNTNLKSGGHGEATYIACQHDIACPLGQGWENEAKAIGMVRLKYNYNGGIKYSIGTCFFINEENDYLEDDKPFIVTAGHLFHPCIDEINRIFLDIRQSYESLDIIVEYINRTCNDPQKRYGRSIGLIDILEIGTSYNKDTKDPNSGYKESWDYALFQTHKKVRALDRYDIVYAGWSFNFDQYDPGYTAIGHPGGDVKKILVDNDRAYESTAQDEFGLYFDFGVEEGGFSGSPIFNSDKEVVGWLCTGEGNCLDRGSARAGCGEWHIFHSLNHSYYAPSFYFTEDWFDFQAGPPPSHCSDCEFNGDETGLDCGGSCEPCGLPDVTIVSSLQDMPNRKAESRWSLVIEPEGSNQIVFSENDYELRSGDRISIVKNVTIPLGTELSMEIDNFLTEEPAQGCGNPCMYIGNYFYPDDDGVLDYLAIEQSFLTSYSIHMFESQGGDKVYESLNNDIYNNGVVNVWDGTINVGSSQLQSGHPYFGTLEYTDCLGNNNNHNFFVYPFF